MEIGSDIPDRLVGDPQRLRQIVTNIIANAIRFTETGEVVLQVAAEGPAANGDIRLRFTVRDTGIGIEPDKLEAIFRPFTQADNSTTRRYGGTRLGLTISDRLARLMGGRIRVESEPGRESTFHFSARFGVAPCQASDPDPCEGPSVEPKAGDTPPRGSARSLNVLVAEDNAVNQKLAVLLLKKLGHQATVVDTGAAALDLLLKREFDLVLMDVQMPVMDGFEATMAYRQAEQERGGRLPIIATTAYAMPGDRESCLRAGMDSYVAKPLSSEQLKAEIEILLPL